MKEIEVYGKTYPVRVTMGALRRYKRETGEEISRMGNVSDKLVTFLYCCTASACNAEKVEFDLDIDTFADGIDISVMNEFANEFGEASSEGEAKKVEPVDIDDLVGMALGGMGMSLSDFEACTLMNLKRHSAVGSRAIARKPGNVPGSWPAACCSLTARMR